MSYSLEFHEDALKEWKKLDAPIRLQFKKLLERRLQEPHVRSARLHGADMQNVYKIKLRDVGYRLVYEVSEAAVTVLVLSVGKRDKSKPYISASHRK